MINKINISLLSNHSEAPTTNIIYSHPNRRLRLAYRPKRDKELTNQEHLQTQQERDNFDDTLYFSHLQRPSTSADHYQGEKKNKGLSQIINVKPSPQRKWSEQDEADRLGNTIREWEHGTRNAPLKVQKQDGQYPSIHQETLLQMSKTASELIRRGRASKFKNSFRQRMLECPEESNVNPIPDKRQFNLKVIGAVTQESFTPDNKKAANIKVAGHQCSLSLVKRRHPLPERNPNRINNSDNRSLPLPQRDDNLLSQRQGHLQHRRKNPSKIGAGEATIQYSIIKPSEIKAVALSSRNAMRETYDKRRRDQNSEYMEILNKISKNSDMVYAHYENRSKARIFVTARGQSEAEGSKKDRLGVEPWETDQPMMMGELI